MSFKYPINSKEKAIRIQEHNKASIPKQVTKKPLNNEGANGDIAIGNTPNGIKLYIKIASQWYTFSPDKETEAEGVYSSSSFASNRTITGATSAADTTDVLATLITDLIKVGIIKKTNQ